MDHTGVRRILASEPAGGKAPHASVQLTGKRDGGQKGCIPFLSPSFGFKLFSCFYCPLESAVVYLLL